MKQGSLAASSHKDQPVPIGVKPGLAKGLPDRDEASALPPLRGGEVSKQLQEPRRSARIESAVAISDAAEGISQSALGANFGGEAAAPKLFSGAMVATPGEIALLAPVDVASLTLLRLLQLRYRRELDRAKAAKVPNPMAILRLDLAISNIDTVVACVRGLGLLVETDTPGPVRLAG